MSTKERYRPQRDMNPVPPGSESTTLPMSYPFVFAGIPVPRYHYDLLRPRGLHMTSSGQPLGSFCITSPSQSVWRAPVVGALSSSPNTPDPGPRGHIHPGCQTSTPRGAANQTNCQGRVEPPPRDQDRYRQGSDRCK